MSGRFWFGVLTVGAITPLAAQSPPFSVTDTSVRQGRFEAVALSRDTILSTYPRAAREVRFRFSINGAENEFPPGTEHTIYLRPRNGTLVTRVYLFADETEPPPPTPEESASSEDGTAQVTFRVDLRGVLAAIRAHGAYDPPLGARITHIDHVYVVGEPDPLSWEYASLRPGSQMELTDRDGDGIYEGTVSIATQYTRPLGSGGRGIWARSADLSRFPALSSSERLQDAIYRMSLEELTQLTRTDGALSAGAKWPGVWTRDVSLSTILALAIVAPDAARTSLLVKVDSLGRIIQDTGTGGSWPVSSDRMVWALAAWEIYASTGDRAWLRQAYDITRRSAEADLHAVRDARNGLFDGESSFLDWREQSYPRWMQPADIYNSENLGTNAVHYAAYRTLATMARALGEPAARWDSVADSLRSAFTTELWQADRGWFGQYRYGRVYRSLSPRSEGLGEALSVIYGVATPAERSTLVRRMPTVTFGTPTIWPYISGERFYHNATIWPFVTAYATWAAADAGNTTAVTRGLDDATRSAALFLTNKENMVAATGHYEGTALNSDRQLWSVAGTLASTFRLLLGMRLESERLVFRPMVPPSYAGERTLTNLPYRNATLSVTVRGYGNAVATAKVDGHAVATAELPATLSGAHTIEIIMNRRWPADSVHVVASRFAPATPKPTVTGGRIEWPSIAEATGYVVYRNGAPLTRTKSSRFPVPSSHGLAEYQVLAVNAVGDASFLSEPLRVVSADNEQFARPGGNGPVSLIRDPKQRLTITADVARAGVYVIDARYANGSGPVNTEDKVAVRTLVIDSDTAGVLVMPQRGSNNWAEWGWTNPLRLSLSAGRHTFTLVFTPLDENMNRHVSSALFDELRLTRLADDKVSTHATP